MALPTSCGFLAHFSLQVDEMLLNVRADLPSNVLECCLLPAAFHVPCSMIWPQSSEQTPFPSGTLTGHGGQVEGCRVEQSTRGTPSPSSVAPSGLQRKVEWLLKPAPGVWKTLPVDGLNQESQFLQLLCQTIGRPLVPLFLQHVPSVL